MAGKKRGKKIKSSRKKPASPRRRKGYARILEILKKHYSKKFESPAQRRKKASELWKDIKEVAKKEGKKPRASVKKVRDRLSQKRVPGKKQPPFIDEHFFQPKPFFEIDGMIETVALAIPDNVWIYGELIFCDPKFFLKGHTKYLYHDTFKEWCDYCGRLQSADKAYYGSDEICFRLDNLHWSTLRKRWEVEVISCDLDGIRFDYGFCSGRTPEKEEAVPEPVLPGKPVPIFPSSPPPSSALFPEDEEDIGAEIILEKEKRKTLKAKTKADKASIAKIKEINELVKTLKSINMSDKEIQEAVKKLL